MLPRSGAFTRSVSASDLVDVLGCISSSSRPTYRPELRLDYPLNLSILVSGGIETEQDLLSNGERTGESSYREAKALAFALWCVIVDPVVLQMQVP